jgi:hypothetical protein
LAISTTKTELQTAAKTFVTLRFAGDDLDPADISNVLPIKPTRAHRKGEMFFAGPRAGTLRGRTGIWYLATDKFLDSDRLDDHLRFVHDLLYPESGDNQRLVRLRDILGRTHSQAHVTCFWHGNPGETPPSIPSRFKAAIDPLAADIETDFAVAPEAGRPDRRSAIRR